MSFNSLYEDCYILKIILFIPNFNSSFYFKKNDYEISLGEKNLKFNFMINCTGLNSPIFHKNKIDANLDIAPHQYLVLISRLKKIKLNTIVYP